MSTLKALLKDVPVEWKALESLTKSIKTGLNPRSNFVLNPENAQNYYVTVKEITSGKISFSNKTDRIDDKAIDIIQKRSNLEVDDVLFSGIGTIGKVAIVDIPVSNWNCSESVFLIKSIRELISPKYLMYLLDSPIIRNQYEGSAVGSTLRGVRMETLKKLQIPIPYPNDPEKSLAIQQEIVRVLDGLSEQNKALTTALAQEIDLRKKQYEYYREELFRFEGKEVEWKTLGDVGDVKMCKRIFKNETTDVGEVPFYKIGTFGKTANAFISKELYESYKSKFSYPKKGDVLISAAGTIGRTVVFNGEPSYFQDSNIIWIDNNEDLVTNEFLCHFYTIAKWYVSGGSIIDRLYNDNVRKTKIPIPFPNDKERSIKEQDRIVRLLDQYDEATKNIVAQLEKEIELRNKQYEYYRNLLLSFPKETN